MPGDKKLPHTAITSWNGFIYQGKVALFYALKLLCDDKEASLNYVLQLDSLDDFAFLDGDNIISMHQVKAKKSKNFSAYQEAVTDTKNRANDKDCDNVFFHVAQEISDKDITSIEAEFSPVKVFRYDELYYCALDNIDVEIEKQIKQYFVTNNPTDIWRLDADYLKRVRCFLDQIILEQVIKIHTSIHQNLLPERQAAYQQTISLTIIGNILNSNLYEVTGGDDYYYYLILGDFHWYYQEFCLNIDEKDEELLKKLSNYMFVIDKLTKEDVLKFIQNIMPHRVFKLTLLSDYKDSLPKDEIQDAFFKILKQLKEADFNDEKNILIWKMEGPTAYYPTSIVHGQGNASKICLNIVKNALDIDHNVLYENNFLITADINVESILDEAKNIINLENAERRDKRITNWKKVSLVKLEDAEGIIND